MATSLLPEVYHNPEWNLSTIQEKRTIGHYSNLQKILLIGEGDFSFSSALASAFGSAVNIMATSLDSLYEVLTKYQQAEMTLWNLYQRGAFILHNVDATRVAVHPVIRRIQFDTIVWNLPHAGFFGKAESDETVIKKHKTLLKSFFSNASILLKDAGEVHVSHQSHGPYKKWEVENLAHLSGLKLKESVPFHPGTYPGYRNRRGVGKFASDSFALGTSKTYKFVHSPDAQNHSLPVSPGLHGLLPAKQEACISKSTINLSTEPDEYDDGRESPFHTLHRSFIAALGSDEGDNKQRAQTLEDEETCEEVSQLSSRKSLKNKKRRSKALTVSLNETRSEESKRKKPKQHQNSQLSMQDLCSTTEELVSRQRCSNPGGQSGELHFKWQFVDRGSGVRPTREGLSSLCHSSSSKEAFHHPGQVRASELNLVFLNRIRDPVDDNLVTRQDSNLFHTGEHHRAECSEYEKTSTRQREFFIGTSDRPGRRSEIHASDLGLQSNRRSVRWEDGLTESELRAPIVEQRLPSVSYAERTVRKSDEKLSTLQPEFFIGTSDHPGRRSEIGASDLGLQSNRRSVRWEDGHTESELRAPIVEQRLPSVPYSERTVRKSEYQRISIRQREFFIGTSDRPGRRSEIDARDLGLQSNRRSVRWEDGLTDSELRSRIAKQSLPSVPYPERTVRKSDYENSSTRQRKFFVRTSDRPDRKSEIYTSGLGHQSNRTSVKWEDGLTKANYGLAS